MKNYSILEIAYWQCAPRQAAFTTRFYSVLLFMGASLIISLAAYAGSMRKFVRNLYGNELISFRYNM